MRRIWFVALALSLGLNAGLLYTVISHHHPREPRDAGWPGPPPEVTGPGERPMMPNRLAFARHRLERMAKWLKLDAVQREAMGVILEDCLPRVLAQRDAVQAARRLAAQQYLKSGIDADSVRISVHRLTAAQAALDSLVAESMSREAKLLTPEQRARYFASMPWGDRPGPDRDAPPRPRHRDR